MELNNDDIVQLHSLVAACKHNGLLAQLVQFHCSRGRWELVVISSQSVPVKPENIARVCSYREELPAQFGVRPLPQAGTEPVPAF